jgi:hypothetical protein
MQDNQAHIILNDTNVGRSFLLLAQIKVKLVSNVKKYSCQMLIPKIRPGIIITALAVQLAASTLLYNGTQYSLVKNIAIQFLILLNPDL